MGFRKSTPKLIEVLACAITALDWDTNSAVLPNMMRRPTNGFSASL